MKENKLLLVPDVHGRDFWIEPVNKFLEESHDGRVIFLGDYVDPYNFEFPYDFDCKSTAFVMLGDIINLKSKYPDRITLLIGNHDCGYMFSNEICDCRTDIFRYSQIRNLFLESKDLFQIADEETINGKHFIFSHAGILKDYAEDVFDVSINEDNVVSNFNEAYYNGNEQFIYSLSYYDKYRGWLGRNNPSLVWADVRTWMDREKENKASGYGFNVFGHTRTEKNSEPIIGDSFEMIDTQNVYAIDNEGNIKKV